MILDFLGIKEFFWKLIIGIVGGIYSIVNYIYQIFLVLAQSNIFQEEQYVELTTRVYIILGVVMLFILAYNLLMLIVDPDKKESEYSIEKILKNIVISFILIVVCPSIFSFAFDVQDSVLNSGVINKFFSDTSSSGFDNNSIKSGGRMMAYNTFIAFFTPASGKKDTEITNKSNEGAFSYLDDNNKVQYVDCTGNSFLSSGNCTLAEAKLVAQKAGTFSVFKAFAKNIDEGEVDFDNALIAIASGIYLAYVILSFCFDMAVRVVKLAFYQIIAPVAIICRILPKSQDVFNKWLKATAQTYLAVFIRVLIMTMGIYLITKFIQSDFFESYCKDCSFGVQTIAYAFIILGIITFIKQAPKLLDDIFGLGGNVSLGIKEKLKGGGAFAAGAAIGSGVTSLTRNATHAVENVRKAGAGETGWKKASAKIAAVGRGIGSTAAGAVSGTARGVYAGKDAGSAGDMKAAAGKAVKETTDKRDRREAYRASHKIGNFEASTPFIGGVATVLSHGKDVVSSVGKWAGVNNIEGLQDAVGTIDKIDSKKSAMRSAAEEKILSEAAKSKSTTFGITAPSSYSFKDHTGSNVTLTEALNASIIRQKQQILEAARSSGDQNRIIDAQNEFDAYKKAFVDAVQEQALLSDDHYKGLAIDHKDVLTGIRGKADEFKQELIRNLGQDYVKDAGLSSANVGTSLDMKLNDLKDLGAHMNVAKQEAVRKISEIQDQERAKSGDKK